MYRFPSIINPLTLIIAYRHPQLNVQEKGNYFYIITPPPNHNVNEVYTINIQADTLGDKFESSECCAMGSLCVHMYLNV